MACVTGAGAGGGGGGAGTVVVVGGAGATGAGAGVGVVTGVGAGAAPVPALVLGLEPELALEGVPAPTLEVVAPADVVVGAAAALARDTADAAAAEAAVMEALIEAEIEEAVALVFCAVEVRSATTRRSLASVVLRRASSWALRALCRAT